MWRKTWTVNFFPPLSLQAFAPDIQNFSGLGGEDEEEDGALKLLACWFLYLVLQNGEKQEEEGRGDFPG